MKSETIFLKIDKFLIIEDNFSGLLTGTHVNSIGQY